jgi:lipopolysaccharide/colanic/teichoic acid biosynthesis glycosyltransferase
VIKRLFDLATASFGLLLLSPVFAIVAIAIKFDSPGPVFFRQRRMGRRFRPFLVWKFRTMVRHAPRLGPEITTGFDPRITRVGRLIRRTKLDELPQLINVITGDMSLVGPRPEVPRYVRMFRKDYRTILTVRPGITDLASLKYRDEQEMLGRIRDPERFYRTRVLPDKIRLARLYIRQASFSRDLRLIFLTLGRIFS